MEAGQDWRFWGASGGGEKGEIGEPLGGQRIKRDHGRASPAHLDSQEPAKIPGLILCSPRPPPAVRVLREWEGGKGSKSKGQTSRTGTPEGWLGREGVPTPSGIHPQLGVQRG